jgi:peptide subunit release factor 1 (eRF1)
MKSATVRELKKELQERSHVEIRDLCLRLSRFKKENKELLTYLLFERSDEQGYIASVKEEIDEKFRQVNRKSPYFVKKSIRSILNHTKKYIRYSQNKETEMELLLYFCQKLDNFKPSIKQNRKVHTLYLRLLKECEKKIDLLHEDLQYDFRRELEQLESDL